MSVEENKRTVQRWFTQVVRGGTPAAIRVALAQDIISPDFLGRTPGERTWEALLGALDELLVSLSDLRFTVEKIIGEGDLVAVRLCGEAIHGGRRVTWTEHEFFRFENGRIVESWGEGSLDDALAEL